MIQKTQDCLVSQKQNQLTETTCNQIRLGLTLSEKKCSQNFMAQKANYTMLGFFISQPALSNVKGCKLG